MQRWDLRSLDVEPHRPEVLQSEGEGRSIVIELPAGERLQEHQVHERAWLVVIDGEVEISQPARRLRPAERHEARRRLLLRSRCSASPPRRRDRGARPPQPTRLLLLVAPWPGERADPSPSEAIA